MVRGPHPYAIIVDDVKKDQQKRTYDWYMQIPDDVEFVPQADGITLLAERNEERVSGRPNVGSRRLLVVPLGPGERTVKLEEYTSGITRGQAHKARRLVITRTGLEGRFRVLLWPFRTTIKPTGGSSRDDWKESPLGARLPTVSSVSSSGFTLSMGSQEDAWTFTPAQDGRTGVLLRRGQGHWRVD
jgi:hypothetical protein